MYLGFQTKADTAARAAVLERLYISLARVNAAISIPTCAVCEQPTPGHESEDCTLESPSEAPAGCCKRDAEKHNSKLCPNRFCYRCRTHGHRTSTCDKEMACYRCHQSNHTGAECLNAQVCRLYGKPYHYSFECTSACRTCRAVDAHDTADCPLRVCKNCGKKGHIAKECAEDRQSTKTCNLCKEPGHIAGTVPRRLRTWSASSAMNQAILPRVA